MSRKTVRREFDPQRPPSPTEKEQAEIDALKGLPDSEIDFSEIPPLDEEFWKGAVRNPYYRPRKQQLTLRLDADLVAWFKRRPEGGRGYQTRINDALREYIQEQQKKAG